MYHLDKIFLDTQWNKKDNPEAIQSQIIQKDKWIIEWHYHDTLENRVYAADLIVLLDTPVRRCITNVHLRLIKAIVKPQVWVLEAFRHMYNFNFLFKWIPDYPRRKKNILQTISNTNSSHKLLELKNFKEVDERIITFKQKLW